MHFKHGTHGKREWESKHTVNETGLRQLTDSAAYYLPHSSSPPFRHFFECTCNFFNNSLRPQTAPAGAMADQFIFGGPVTPENPEGEPIFAFTIVVLPPVTVRKWPRPYEELDSRIRSLQQLFSDYSEQYIRLWLESFLL